MAGYIVTFTPKGTPGGVTREARIKGMFIEVGSDFWRGFDDNGEPFMGTNIEPGTSVGVGIDRV